MTSAQPPVFDLDAALRLQVALRQSGLGFVCTPDLHRQALALAASVQRNRPNAQLAEYLAPIYCTHRAQLQAFPELLQQAFAQSSDKAEPGTAITPTTDDPTQNAKTKSGIRKPANLQTWFVRSLAATFLLILLGAAAWLIDQHLPRQISGQVTQASGQAAIGTYVGATSKPSNAPAERSTEPTTEPPTEPGSKPSLPTSPPSKTPTLPKADHSTLTQDQGQFSLTVTKRELPLDVLVRDGVHEDWTSRVDALPAAPLQITLARKPAPPGQDQTADPEIKAKLIFSIDPYPAPPPSFEQTESTSQWHPWRLAALLIPALVLLLVWLAWLALRGAWLQRHIPPLARVHDHLLRIDNPMRGLIAMDLQGLSHELRRRVWQASGTLNLDDTLKATLALGGMPRWIYGHKVEPEYLALIDDRARNDHLARLADSLMAHLQQRDVRIDRYFFDDDLRRCYGPAREGEPRPHSLAQDADPAGTRLPDTDLASLLARYRHHRLLLVTDGAPLFNLITGQPHAWVKDLLQGPLPTLLTPTPLQRWSRRESALSALGFLVLPLDTLGFELLAELTPNTLDDDPQALLDAARNRPAHRAMREKIGADPSGLSTANTPPAPWISRPEHLLSAVPQGSDDAKALIAELRSYFSGLQAQRGDAPRKASPADPPAEPDVLRLLRACAVYPMIDWALTLRLATRVLSESKPSASPRKRKGAHPTQAQQSDPAHPQQQQQQQQQRITLAQRLTHALPLLSRLPWLRDAYLPDWLRTELVQGMTEHDADAVRSELAALLAQARLQGSSPTAKTQSAPATPTNHADALWLPISVEHAPWWRRRDAADPTHLDRVLLRFQMQRPQLGVSAGDAVRKALFKDGLWTLGLKAAPGMMVTLVVTLAISLIWPPYSEQAAVVMRQQSAPVPVGLAIADGKDAPVYAAYSDGALLQVLRQDASAAARRFATMPVADLRDAPGKPLVFTSARNDLVSFYSGIGQGYTVPVQRLAEPVQAQALLGPLGVQAGQPGTRQSPAGLRVIAADSTAIADTLRTAPPAELTVIAGSNTHSIRRQRPGKALCIALSPGADQAVVVTESGLETFALQGRASARKPSSVATLPAPTKGCGTSPSGQAIVGWDIVPVTSTRADRAWTYRFWRYRFDSGRLDLHEFPELAAPLPISAPEPTQATAAISSALTVSPAANGATGQDNALQASLSQDGQTLALLQNGTVFVYQLGTGKRISRLPSTTARQIALAPDGLSLAVINTLGRLDLWQLDAAGPPDPALLPPGSRFRDCQDAACPWLVVLPQGRFMMGSPESEQGREPDESPRHEVRIDYKLGMMETEVTRGQFAAFVAATGHKTEGGCFTWDGKNFTDIIDASWRKPGFDQTDTHPVTCVNWQDATAYAAWLSKKTGKIYRLPSEAEWEYAARGVTTSSAPSTRYSFGDDPDYSKICRHGNVADEFAKKTFKDWTTATCDDGFLWTAPVGRYQRNNFGLYDMHGNVWEWAQDCWQDTYRGTPVDGKAFVKNDCGIRVLRGGSWSIEPRLARAADRYLNDATVRYFNMGFRLTRTLP